MTMPKRRKPAKLGCRETPQIRSAGHLKWIRGHECAVARDECANYWPCRGRIEAAHVRTGTDGAMSVKPSDCWTIPLCSEHHYEQHGIGEAAFEHLFSIDMKKIAAELWRRSPHRHKHTGG